VENELEILVEKAKEGDKDSLELLVREIQDNIYGLAIRMLWYPSDAEDASQEILIKVITHLDSFRGESAFTSWVYRIASNHLINTNKCRVAKSETSFKSYEENINSTVFDKQSSAVPGPEQSLVMEEIMIGCTMGMLLCLDRDLRIAYILGGITEMKGAQCAYILDITPEAFRKRFSRAKKLLNDFMNKKCGLVNPENSCRCSHYIDKAVETGFDKPENMMFAGKPCIQKKGFPDSGQLQEMEELQRTIMIFRSHPDYTAPEKFVEGIKDLLSSGTLSISGVQ
jgi:RNA polymerase sigma factor (sigma-70 family)